MSVCEAVQQQAEPTRAVVVGGGGKEAAGEHLGGVESDDLGPGDRPAPDWPCDWGRVPGRLWTPATSSEE